MHHPRPNTLLPVLLLALATSAALALPNESESAWQRERASCLAGGSPQGRTTCLKEADAARAEMRRHRLDNGETPAQLRANALLRCQRVLDTDRSACERMVLGEGTRSGSVAAGGVLTEITTVDSARLPAPAASR